MARFRLEKGKLSVEVEVESDNIVLFMGILRLSNIDIDAYNLLGDEWIKVL